MTISTTVIKNSYSGNGSNDTFAYTFKISANADMQVIIRASTGTETVKNLTTHYTVTGAGNANGGNVVFTSGNIPTNTETVVLRRNTTQTQGVDLVENDPFTAESVEGAFDKNLSIAQELQEQIDRSIKLSRTNTINSTEFTSNATARSSKVLAFDTNGELTVASELGSYKGNWATSTIYGQRDIIKDTSNNNIYICVTGHTSSGSQPISSNTDVAKWALLVDAASASTSQTAAAASASTASGHASTATTKASEAASSASTALSHKNAAEPAKSAAETAQTAAETAKTAAETALDTFDDRFLGAKSSNPTVDNDGNALIDGALYFDTTNDLMKVYNLANTTWYQLALTGSNQTAVNTVSSSIASVNTVANGLDTGALTGSTSFAEKYRVASSAPTSSLDQGDLYFDTTANELKVYKSSGWAAAGSTVNGTANRFIYNITGTPTTLSGASGTGFAEASSKVLAYDAGFIDVYLNGVKQILGTDITATSGTSVVFGSALANGDVVDIVAYGTFELANININDLTNTPSSLGSAGQALVVNNAGNALVYSNASTPEVYGFHTDSNGQLIVTTTNEGADNISEATHAAFDDVVFASSGITWSISGANLIATI